MPDLVAKMCHPEVMRLAWQATQRKKGYWAPRVPVIDVECNFNGYVEQLLSEIQSGRYRPDPLFCFDVAKPKGGTRLVCAPYVRDKLVQRAALLVLEPLAEAYFHPASFGYRPLCTIDMALARLREGVRQGYIWLGDTDIMSCFDMIPQKPVLRLVELLCEDRGFCELIALWFDTLPPRFRRYGNGIGLPQGLVISPLLCNLYLNDLDMDLEEAGIPFVRYADNLMVMARDEPGAYTALEFAAQSIASLSLELNLEQTFVLKSCSSHRFLGKRLPTPREWPLS